MRPDRAQLPGEDAYRFRHLLIRDAAYDALPKAARAELHERFATWMDERASDLVELDEVVGYHLERAHGYRVELGPESAATRDLAARAADRIAAAGKKAAARGDVRASTSLLARAVELYPRRTRAGTVFCPVSVVRCKTRASGIGQMRFSRRRWRQGARRAIDDLPRTPPSR